MPTVANTLTTYNTGAVQKEEVSNVLYRVAMEKTPFLDMVPDMAITSKKPEWLTEELRATNANNAQLEGANAPTASNQVGTRNENYTQISNDSWSVTGTEDAVAEYGVGSNKMGYQQVRAAIAIKKDMETILLSNQVPDAGDAVTARKLRPLEGWYATNVSRGSGGANGTTSAAATDGTQRAFTEALLINTLGTAWENGADGIDTLLVGRKQRETFSTFTGSKTVNLDGEDKRIVNTVDIWVGDFNTIKVVPTVHCRARTAHLLDTDYLSIGILRRMETYRVAKTADKEQDVMQTEYTLCVKNEKALAVIADLNT